VASAQSFTLAASNNRDHVPQSLSTYASMFNHSQVSIGRDAMPQSLYYYLFVPHIYIYGCCSSCTSRLSWWITHLTQCQRRGCNNIPSFLQRTTQIACFFVKAAHLHILVTAPFCCDRRAQAACAQSFTLRQEVTTEITWQDHSIKYCLFAPHIYGLCSSRTSWPFTVLTLTRVCAVTRDWLIYQPIFGFYIGIGR